MAIPSKKSKLDLGLSAVPRYLQLASLFRHRIESGAWATGKQIPTVEELVAECGVARATVRQAMGILADEGLIIRRRATGTIVTRKPADTAWHDIATDWRRLLTVYPDGVIKLISSEIVKAPPALPHDIGEPCASYRHLQREHWRDGRPYLITDVYVDAALARKLPNSAFTTLTALSLAASLPGVKIVNARQTLTIGSADIETAAALKIPLNSPIARIHRSVVDQRRKLIMTATGIYRGDVVRVEIKTG